MDFNTKVNTPNWCNVVAVFKTNTPEKDWYPLAKYSGKKTAWNKFITKCGLRHISFTRLDVANKKKYVIAKLKYGF